MLPVSETFGATCFPRSPFCQGSLQVLANGSGKLAKDQMGFSAMILAVVVLLCLFPNQLAHAQCKVMTHDLQVYLEPETQQLIGSDTLTFSCPGAHRVLIELNPAATIHSVDREGVPVHYEFDSGILKVPLRSLRSSGKKEETISLTIRYASQFSDPVPMDPVNTEDPTYGVTGVISREGVLLLAGSRWFPQIPGSPGKVRLQVDLPEAFDAVTSGTLMSRRTQRGRTVCVWQIDQPVRGLSLSAGPYAVVEGRAREIPTAFYHFRHTEVPVKIYLDAVSRYMDLYQDLFGPYPFPKFAVVENFLPTGYGFASYTLLGSRVIRLPFIVETSLGHEVAHSWWGNGVFVEYRKGNWSEGLTTYVADHLFKERSSEEEGREYRWQMLRTYSNLVSPQGDFALSDFLGRDSPASRAVGYGKGAMVFHMARNLAGNDAFWKSLADVYRNRLFQEASWEDFAAALSSNTKEDFGSFFRQWVLRPGAPVIRLEDVRAERTEAGWKVHGTLVQDGDVYWLHVPLRLEWEKGFLDRQVEVKSARVPFVLEGNFAPERLVVDPRVDVFRRLHPTEIPPDVNSIKGSKGLMAIMAEGHESILTDSARTLLQGLGHGDTPLTAEKDVDRSSLTGKDILLFGYPSSGEFLTSLPKGVSMARDHFVLDGVKYKEKGHAAFLVVPSPVNRNQSMGVFLPLSNAAAVSAARKITHYGTSSAVIFLDGTMQAKKLWPLSHSPLIHTFASKE